MTATVASSQCQPGYDSFTWSADRSALGWAEWPSSVSMDDRLYRLAGQCHGPDGKLSWVRYEVGSRSLTVRA